MAPDPLAVAPIPALPPADPPPVESSASRSPAHAGFEASASIGYALPAGSTTGVPGDDLTHLFSGQVPIRLQIGGNVIPSLFIGGYASVAPGGAGDGAPQCSNGTLSCNSTGVRGGVVLEYHFDTGALASPWLGYGFGYESNTVYLNSNSSSAQGSVNVQGWDYAVLRGGVDFYLSQLMALGFYGEVSIGQYGHATESAPNTNADADISNQALHQWISFGLRARVMP